MGTWELVALAIETYWFKVFPLSRFRVPTAEHMGKVVVTAINLRFKTIGL